MHVCLTGKSSQGAGVPGRKTGYEETKKEAAYLTEGLPPKSLLWTSSGDSVERERIECLLELSKEGVLGCLFIGSPFVLLRCSLHSEYTCLDLVSTPPPPPLFMESENPKEEATLCHLATSSSLLGNVQPNHS